MSSHFSQNISIKDIELNARENGLTLKLYATDEINYQKLVDGLTKLPHGHI